VGRRDGHDGFVVAHAADDDPTAIEVVLSVTRRA
jgi:hypothetical protein